jgi:hypothetical protein
MPNLIERLAKNVEKRLKTIGCERPSFSVQKALLETAYHATLRTEEGRLIRGSITYTHPKPRPEDGPARRRADYPGLWPLSRRLPLTVERLVKLSRAIDMWSGSIGVYGTKVMELHIWGVVDQLVQYNVRINLEGDDGFYNPGMLHIMMDGVGDLTVYHRGIFLGGLRGHQLIIREYDALRTAMFVERIVPHLARPAEAIRVVLGSAESPVGVLVNTWINTVYRLCIGLRRYSTGGTLLITPSPQIDQLEISYKFNYRRLGDAVILSVLDNEYREACQQRIRHEKSEGTVQPETITNWSLAQADAEDRQSELTAAVKVFTSLASLDGLVLLSPALHVQGFGVKIKTGDRVGTVYDGAGFERHGVNAKKIDPSRFGTRHNSVLRYCRVDKNAIGVVISQDGHVRMAMSTGRSLVLCDNVKLLGYNSFSLHSVGQVQR